MNKKYFIYSISIALLLLSGWLCWQAFVVPTQPKRRLSYVAEGSIRTIVDGKISTYCFFRRYGDLDGQSRTEMFYLNYDGSFRNKKTKYCLKSGEFEERNGIVEKQGSGCMVLNTELITPDEKILGLPTSKRSQVHQLDTGSISVTTWLSPSLNTIIKHEKVDKSRNVSNILEITWYREQANDPSTFALPANVPITQENGKVIPDSQF